MEIKTLAEVRAGNVTVTVTTTEPEGYEPEQAAEVLAENYARARQRITEPEGQLDRATKGHVCTERCEPNQHVAFIGRQRLIEAERRVIELERQLLVIARDQPMAAELELRELRADVRRQAEELNKRFTFAQVEDAKADARASEGARIRSEIRGLLNRPGIEQRMSMEQSPGAQELARVIRQVRELLDQPTT